MPGARRIGPPMPRTERRGAAHTPRSPQTVPVQPPAGQIISLRWFLALPPRPPF